MDLRHEALDSPVWRAWLVPDEVGHVALGGPGVHGLEQLLLHAQASPHCRVLVIASEGAEFCRGMDLQGLVGASQGDPEIVAAQVATFARCLTLLRGLRAATVCVIEGAASGGGVGLAAACDMAIAGPAASFALPELFFGLIPAVVMPVIAARIGLQRTRWLALSGDVMAADEALRIGLVDERSDDISVTLAARLKYLLRCSPAAVDRLKRFAAEHAERPLPAALAAGVARTVEDIDGPEVAAAVAGFLQGELPPWAVRYRPGGHG